MSRCQIILIQKKAPSHVLWRYVPAGGGTVEAKLTRQLFQEGKAGERMVAVVTYTPGTRGKHYRLVTDVDLAVFRQTEVYLAEKRERLTLEWGMDAVPDEPTPEGKGSGAERAFSVRNYGMNTWGNLFNIRQQLALITFAEKVKAAYQKLIVEWEDEEYAKAVVSYLALAVDRLASFSTTLCMWKTGTEQNIPVFSGRTAMPMVFDYFEINSIGDVSTSWINSIGTITEPLDGLCCSLPSVVKIAQVSATNLSYSNDFFDAVFTDPPYYDNVPYSYLSDFFYVWLKRNVGHCLP